MIYYRNVKCDYASIHSYVTLIHILMQYDFISCDLNKLLHIASVFLLYCFMFLLNGIPTCAFGTVRI